MSVVMPVLKAASEAVHMTVGSARVIGFFLIHWPPNYAGFGALALANAGIVVGSLLGSTTARGANRNLGVAG